MKLRAEREGVRLRAFASFRLCGGAGPGAPVARALLLGSALTGCVPSSAGSGAPEESAIENSALAVDALVGAEGLWLVAVREAEAGGQDLNGDGDAHDRIVHVLELPDGRPRSLGLALGDDEDPLALWACDGASAAFGVSERAQGGHDRNGDGDALDRVLVVLERGVARAHPLALHSLVVGGALVACALDEAAQGGLDLDFDGDAEGTVLRVFDTSDGAELAFGLRDAVPLAIASGDVALRLAEREGLDLNGDGDDQDRAVFEILDGETRLLHNTTLVLASDAVASTAGTFGVSVDEAGMGRGDLTGDGEADDAAFFVYSPSAGFSLNLGLSVPLWPPPLVDERSYLLLAQEAAGGGDRNGDGDRDDWIVHVFEAGAARLHATGLASQGSAVLLGAHVGVSVSEAMHGSSDLDGDGDADGDVVHVYELAGGAPVALGLDAFRLLSDGTRLFVVLSEDEGATDWNADGDRRDRVLFDWSSTSASLRSSGAVAGELLAARQGTVLVRVSERESGVDHTLDGDRADSVLELLDVTRQERATLALALGSNVRFAAGGVVLVLVDESGQGRDLNGDGDRSDEVLHLVRP